MQALRIKDYFLDPAGEMLIYLLKKGLRFLRGEIKD